jgi:hypothetical protein
MTKCSKCHKEVETATMFKQTGTDIFIMKGIWIGYECGCFNKYLKFIKKRSPLSRIERLNWGARIYFNKGEDEAIQVIKDFVRGEIFVFR